MKTNQRMATWRLIALLVLGVSLCLTAVSGRADIYRWQDEEGNWHFSDSPTSEAPIEEAPIRTREQRTTPDQPRTANPLATDPVQRQPTPSRPHPKAVIENSSKTVSAQGGMLWRIAKDGADDSYLLGTIHSSDERVVRLRPAVSRALDRSDRFVMEMEMDATALMSFGGKMMFTDGRNLETVLGSGLYTEVVAAMSDLGMPEMVVRTLKPWAAMALLSMPKPSGEPFLDLVLRQRAAGAGKPTAGLETAQEQLSVFENLSMSDQIALLKMTLAQLPSLPSLFDQLIAAYVADDLGRIADLAAQYKSGGNVEAIKRFMLRLNDERNQRMVARMRPFLNQGNSFIAVGALHLPGPTGLIQLLRDRGYDVTPIR